MDLKLKYLILLISCIALTINSQEGSQEVIKDPELLAVVLNGDMFDREVVDPKTRQTITGPWFIKFYAPWCGHCKKLAPLWDQLAEKRGHQVHIGKVDCTQSDNSALCSTYEIEGYPTLLFIKDGNYYKYRGDRSIEAFEEFALNGGYINSPFQDEIPKKVEGMELYQKQFTKFTHQLVLAVDTLFYKIGLDFVPRYAKIGIVSTLFVVPVMLMCYIICCMKDDVVLPEEKEKQEKKPSSRGNREKLD